MLNILQRVLFLKVIYQKEKLTKLKQSSLFIFCGMSEFKCILSCTLLYFFLEVYKIIQYVSAYIKCTSLGNVHYYRMLIRICAQLFNGMIMNYIHITTKA